MTTNLKPIVGQISVEVSGRVMVWDGMCWVQVVDQEEARISDDSPESSLQELVQEVFGELP